MDLNLVRIEISITTAAACSFESAMLRNPSSIEAMLGELCRRELSTDPELLRRHQKPGLPFVFNLPEHGDNGISRIALMLMGPSIPSIRLFTDVVEAHSGGGAIISLHAIDYQGTITEIGRDGGDSMPVLSALDILDLETPLSIGCRTVFLRITTPLRISSGGREMSRLDPTVFIRAMLRRISSLAAYYGAPAEPDCMRMLAAASEEINCRRTSAVEAPTGRRGLTGLYELKGNLEDIAPYLMLGSMLHLGKGASYGMGSFDVIMPDIR